MREMLEAMRITLDNVVTEQRNIVAGLNALQQAYAERNESMPPSVESPAHERKESTDAESVAGDSSVGAQWMQLPGECRPSPCCVCHAV